jgi:hypothetical protein
MACCRRRSLGPWATRTLHGAQDVANPRSPNGRRHLTRGSTAARHCVVHERGGDQANGRPRRERARPPLLTWIRWLFNEMRSGTGSRDAPAPAQGPERHASASLARRSLRVNPHGLLWPPGRHLNRPERAAFDDRLPRILLWQGRAAQECRPRCDDGLTRSASVAKALRKWPPVGRRGVGRVVFHAER